MDKTLGLYTFVGELNSLDFLGLYELETIKHHWNWNYPNKSNISEA